MKTERFRLDPSQKVVLQTFDSADTAGFDDKSGARKRLEDDIGVLADLQDKLNAQARYAVLIVLQGMDTSGKDGAIKHVMTGVNPAGVNVYGFKAPTNEELAHDYLWRASKVLPAKGHIAIFNRSYYEDVLITRVHPHLLGQYEAAAEEHGKAFWERRFSDITHFERYLHDNDTIVLKFFLHISKKEQRKRLLERLDDPSKQWKFSPNDLRERPYWSEYVAAYEHMLSHTSTSWAPWYIIPADHKWFSRLAVARVVVDALRALDLNYPKLAPELQTQIEEAKAELDAE